MNDTPDDAFDRIALRSTQFCETPIALVSVITDNRQWFKAKIGFGPSETPLSQSICKFALSHHGLLIIPDLVLDVRTAANTLVTGEPRFRFYAGVSVVAPDDTPIGSVCVIDTKPRPNGLTTVQEAALQGLAYECSELIAKTAQVKNTQQDARHGRRINLAHQDGLR